MDYYVFKAFSHRSQNISVHLAVKQSYNKYRKHLCCIYCSFGLHTKLRRVRQVKDAVLPQSVIRLVNPLLSPHASDLHHLLSSVSPPNAPPQLVSYLPANLCALQIIS